MAGHQTTGPETAAEIAQPNSVAGMGGVYTSAVGGDVKNGVMGDAPMGLPDVFAGGEHADRLDSIPPGSAATLGGLNGGGANGANAYVVEQTFDQSAKAGVGQSSVNDATSVASANHGAGERPANGVGIRDVICADAATSGAHVRARASGNGAGGAGVLLRSPRAGVAIPAGSGQSSDEATGPDRKRRLTPKPEEKGIGCRSRVKDRRQTSHITARHGAGSPGRLAVTTLAFSGWCRVKHRFRDAIAIAAGLYLPHRNDHNAMGLHRAA